jgi:hypothetical protein
MKIKFELDTGKAARATVAITAFYRLGRVSEGTEYPQLAFSNTITLIIIIAILNGTRLAPLVWKNAPLVRINCSLQQSASNDAQHHHPPLQRGL